MTHTDAATMRADARSAANIADNCMAVAMRALTRAEFAKALDCANHLRWLSTRLDDLAGPEEPPRCVQCQQRPLVRDHVLCAACKVT